MGLKQSFNFSLKTMRTGIMVRKGEAKVVMIVEDEEDVLNFVSRVLELEGYQVLQVKNGDEGIKVVREHHVALMLLDLRLPGIDGWSVLVRMKSDPALVAIPVVMLTASAGAPQRERALSMGAADYLVKPLSAASLRKAVVRVLRRVR